MQVKQRLRINNTVLALSVIAVMAVLLVTALRVRRTMEQEEIAEKLMVAQFERLALRTDYLHTGSERTREQVQAKNTQVGELLKSASEKFSEPEAKKTVAALRENQEQVGKIFRAIIVNRQNTRLNGRNAALSGEIEDRLLTQLNMRVYEAVLLCGRLKESTGAAFVSAVGTGGGLIAFVFLLMAAATLINSVLTNRLITARIDRLHEGASAIGQGNLNHSIDIKGNDEFAGLARSVNEMTAKLQGSYRELENEIEERKRADEAMKESEEKLSLALRSAGMGVWRLDLNEKKRHFDDEVCHCLGLDPASFQGTAEEFYGAVHPEDRARITAALQRTILSGALYETEYRCVWPDGGIHHVAARGRLVRDAEGQARWVDGLVWDVTERRRAEEALRESEERYRSILETLQDGYIRADREGLVIMASPSVVSMFNYESLPELVGKPVLSLYKDHGDRDALLEELKKLGKVNDFQTEAVRKDGTAFPVSLNAQYFYDSQGRIQGTEAFIRDISERKRTEDTLHRTHEELEAANALLRDSRSAALNMMEDAIIARKQVEEAGSELRKSEERYRLLFDNAIDGFAYCRMLFDEHGRQADFIYLAINSSFERLTGLKNVVGKRVTEVIPGIREATPELFEIYGRVATTGQPERFEIDFAPLGKWLSISVYSPEREYFVAVFDDITARKRADEALKRFAEELERKVAKRTRFYSVLAKIGEAIARIRERQALFDEVCHIVVDHGRFRLAWVGLVDPETRRVLPVASCGETAYIEGIRIVAADVPEGMGPTGRAVVEGTHVISADFENDTAMGPWRERAKKHGIRSSFAIPLHVGSDAIGALTIYSDEPGFFSEEEVAVLVALTEDLSFALNAMEIEKKRSEAEEQLRILNEELDRRVQERTSELQEVNKELEAFIYSVSHDLRAPLRAVSEFSRIVNEDYSDRLDEQGRDYLTRVSRGARKMSRLIEDLLYLSRISRQEIDRTEIDMSKIASSIVAELRDAQRGRSIGVRIQEGLVAHADARLMDVALLNILGNAWKFTSKVADARVDFGAEEKDGKTVFFVRDNGAGFEQAYAEKMFLPFQRLHSAEEFEGTGVGLTIVERVIRRHGGRVWAEGAVGKGATVYFTLG